MEVLNKILSLLKEQNKKQSELTSYLGLSKNVFTNWKSGVSASYKKYLPQIAEFFNVSTDYLAGKDFTYALYNEMTHDLSDEKIAQLKQYADFLRNNG